MAHRALAHKVTDDVAVAVADLQPGEELVIQSLEGGKPLEVRTLEAVPLGHKVALKDMAVGHVVIEYGEKVGKVTKAVKKGGWVHVHNIRTLRWDYGKAGSKAKAASSAKAKKGGK
ncbi:MAG: UxaA family hydrolase [Meiothermus sp.]|nr:UxaA family hydrolase [Meiothermus sp.]